MKIILTGAGGFLGRNLAEGLKSDNDIIPLSHSQIDLTDFETVSKIFLKERPEAVIHCAAKPGHRKAADKRDIALINLKLFTSVYYSALNCGATKFIHFGSGSEFDNSKIIDKVSERDFGKRIPSDETGFSRFVMNNLLKDSPIGVNLRCFGVFGKYEDYTMRFISNCICRALFNMDIVINEDKNFSYIYIDDLKNIVSQVLKREKLLYNDYNAVPSYFLNMREIAVKIVEKTNSSSAITVKGKGNDYTALNDRLKKEFDLKFTSFDECLDKLIAYYENIFDTLDKSSL